MNYETSVLSGIIFNFINAYLQMNWWQWQLCDPCAIFRGQLS